MTLPIISDGRPAWQSVDEALAHARDILAAEGNDLRTLLHKEMLLHALQTKDDGLDVLDMKVINRAIAEFRYAARVFKPYRHIRKASIFGSARTPEDDPYYQMAVELGRALAEEDMMVITGAASGIMRAGIEGAGAGQSFGANILLPFEAGPSESFRGDPKLITFRYFFTRKLFFVMEAHACVLFPGGFGTQDEGFEVLTLLQTGKTPPMPVVLMELPGESYWETWEAFIRGQLLQRGYISQEDLSFYSIAHTPREAAETITGYYSTFHSVRRVGGHLVIRLERELSDASLRDLSNEFRDLLVRGSIARSGPLPPEKDEPELLVKPRIVLRWNQRSAGRLNQLIQAINALGAASHPV